MYYFSILLTAWSMTECKLQLHIEENIYIWGVTSMLEYCARMKNTHILCLLPMIKNFPWYEACWGIAEMTLHEMCGWPHKGNNGKKSRYLFLYLLQKEMICDELSNFIMYVAWTHCEIWCDLSFLFDTCCFHVAPPYMVYGWRASIKEIYPPEAFKSSVAVSTGCLCIALTEERLESEHFTATKMETNRKLCMCEFFESLKLEEGPIPKAEANGAVIKVSAIENWYICFYNLWKNQRCPVILCLNFS